MTSCVSTSQSACKRVQHHWVLTPITHRVLQCGCGRERLHLREARPSSTATARITSARALRTLSFAESDRTRVRRGARETPALQGHGGARGKSQPAGKAANSSRRSPDGNGKRRSKGASKDVSTSKPRGGVGACAAGAPAPGKPQACTPQAGLHYQAHSPDYAGIPRPNELLARRASACGETGARAGAS